MSRPREPRRAQTPQTARGEPVCPARRLPHRADQINRSAFVFRYRSQFEEYVRSLLSQADSPHHRYRVAWAAYFDARVAVGCFPLSQSLRCLRWIVRQIERKRIVITGMGVISPNGIGVDAFAQALAAGK